MALGARLKSPIWPQQGLPEVPLIFQLAVFASGKAALITLLWTVCVRIKIVLTIQNRLVPKFIIVVITVVVFWARKSVYPVSMDVQVRKEVSLLHLPIFFIIKTYSK